MLKVESEENDASRCDSTHYENISLLCVIRKKKILSKLSFVCLKKTEESFLLSFLISRERKKDLLFLLCFCCYTTQSTFFSHQSVCQNVEKTTKNERNSS